MSIVTIDPKLCNKDGLCVRICRKVFSQDGEGSVPVVAHEESCNSCGHCVLLCPSGAIQQQNCPMENMHPVRKDLMPTYEQVREMIVSRRSTRAFRERSVGREIIEKVIDGARFAPTAKNTQSTRYIVVQDKSLLHALASGTAAWLGRIARRLRNPLWRKLYLLMGEKDAEEVTRWIGQFGLIAERMKENKDLVLFDAPVLILFHGDRRIRFAGVNANLALQNATMIASSLGLGSLYTGYVVLACKHDKKVLKLLGLPEKHEVFGGLAFGYPALRFSRWIERNPAEVTWM